MVKRKTSLPKILVVGTAVVLFWRGAWGLMDLYIFPDNPVMSYAVSLTAGLGILFASRMLADELL